MAFCSCSLSLSLCLFKSEGGFTDVPFVKNSRLSGSSKNAIEKKNTVSLIQWCLHLGRVFFFHPQIQYLRQSAHNGKLLELQKCRRTKSELISVKMETQAHGESLEKKNLGRRQSYRKMPDISPNLR